LSIFKLSHKFDLSFNLFKFFFLAIITLVLFSLIALAQLQYHVISEIRWGTQDAPGGYISPTGVNLDLYGYNITNVNSFWFWGDIYSGESKGLRTKDIADEAITEAKLGAGAVTTLKIADLAVTGQKLASLLDLAGTKSIIGAADINASRFFQAGNRVLDIATSFSGDVSGTYNNLQLGAGVVGTNEIADNSVTTAKIVDGTIQTIDIADNAITTAKIASVNCGAGKVLQQIGGGTYICVDVNPANVINGTGSSGQVAFFTGTNTIFGSNNLYWDNTNARLGIGTTTPLNKLNVIGDINATGYLYGTLGPNTVATTSIQDGAVTSAKIADGTIQTIDIADNQITSAKIADGTIVDADISATAAISWSKLAGYNLNVAWIGTLGGGNITAGTISTTQLADNSITSAKIVDGTIQTADLGNDIVNSAKLAQDYLSVGKITGNTIYLTAIGGNVGIGTTNPAGKLHVIATSSISGLVISNDTLARSFAYWDADNNRLVIQVA
jgi:hypothetical protein